MTPTIHTVQFSLINELHKQFKIDIFVNNNLKLSVNQVEPVKTKVLKFNHLYNDHDTASCIKVVLTGEEQQNKLFQLHNITVANQPIDVLAGFYYVQENDWWASLSANEYKIQKKKTVRHAAKFGWFGTIEYDFAIWSQGKVMNKKDQSSLGGLPTLGTRGVYI